MNQHTETVHDKERHWREHFERWERCELSQREYCERHALSLSTFQFWRRRLAAAAGTASCLEIVPAFQAPHAVLFGEARLTLVIGDGRYRLEIGDGVSSETLRVVLDAVEAQR